MPVDYINTHLIDMFLCTKIHLKDEVTHKLVTQGMF